MSSELTHLFERTLPPDELVLRKMDAARVRRAATESVRERRGFFAAGRPWVWVGASGFACALGLAFLVAAQNPPIRAEKEQFFKHREGLTAPARPARSAQKAAPSATEQERTLSPPPSRPPTDAEVHAPAAKQRDRASPEDVLPDASAGSALPSATWEAAAQALRTGDQPEAERLLAELARSQDPEVRDGARLVRLRSVVHASPSSPAARLSPTEQAELSTLAQSGATASIRAAARKLLEETSPPKGTGAP